MNYSLLSPVSDRLVEAVKVSHFQTLGRKLKLHTSETTPDLKGVDIAILGVLEARNSIDYIDQSFNLTEIRQSFYSLFPGNWTAQIADLGDILMGADIEDTYFALTDTVAALLKQNIICLLYTSPSPRDLSTSRMPSSA